MKECDIFDIGSGGHSWLVMGPRGQQLYRHNIKYLSLQSQHHPQNQDQNFYLAQVKVFWGVAAESKKYYRSKKNTSDKDIKVGWRQSSKWSAAVRIHSLPPSSLGRAQETIEMCETQPGL